MNNKTKKLLFSNLILILSLITIIIYNYISSSYATTSNAYETNTTMKVHFLNVGEANCILVQSNDCNMLIDAGNYYDGDFIKNYLQSLNIKKLDYVIASHAHEDHIGSMSLIIDTFDIETFIMPSKIHTTTVYNNMLKSLLNKNLPITSPICGATYPIGTGNFTILSPEKDTDDLSINNSSVVIKIRDGDNSFLIGGDIEKDQEKKLISMGTDLKSTILLLNHHGSNTSSCLEYLRAVAPSYAIISVADKNSYNFPSTQVLNRLKKLGIPYYSTSEHGTIIINSNQISYNFDFV